MRLLLITQDFPPATGGIETYCYELAQRFYHSTDYFAVLAPANPGAKFIDRDLPYPVYRVSTKNSLLPVSSLFTVPGLLRKGAFDTVFHAQWQTTVASLASGKMGYSGSVYLAAHARELLISPFAGEGGTISEKLYEWRKKMFKKIDGFFPVSNYTASLLRGNGVDAQKIHVVGNGTDPGFFKPEPSGSLRSELDLQDKKVILTICRLVPRKGIDLVLRALKEIIRQREREDLVYLIGGSGPDGPRLKALANRLGLEDYVRFTGRIPGKRLPLYYSLGDVFVMPARNEPPEVEGFGIVFLEANACETPVIGTRTGGIPDAIEDGETGLLIDEGETVQLTHALLKLLDNPDWARSMGKKGRQRVLEKATWDHVAANLLEKMELINRKKGR